eukprot:CFRG4059T1
MYIDNGGQRRQKLLVPSAAEKSNNEPQYHRLRNSNVQPSQQLPSMVAHQRAPSPSHFDIRLHGMENEDTNGMAQQHHLSRSESFSSASAPFYRSASAIVSAGQDNSTSNKQEPCAVDNKVGTRGLYRGLGSRHASSTSSRGRLRSTSMNTHLSRWTSDGHLVLSPSSPAGGGPMQKEKPSRKASICPKIPRKRRSFSELVRNHKCHYDDCERVYASTLALVQHLKIKHNDYSQLRNSQRGQPTVSRTTSQLSKKSVDTATSMVGSPGVYSSVGVSSKGDTKTGKRHGSGHTTCNTSVAGTLDAKGSQHLMGSNIFRTASLSSVASIFSDIDGLEEDNSGFPTPTNLQQLSTLGEYVNDDSPNLPTDTRSQLSRKVEPSMEVARASTAQLTIPFIAASGGGGFSDDELCALENSLSDVTMSGKARFQTTAPIAIPKTVTLAQTSHRRNSSLNHGSTASDSSNFALDDEQSFSQAVDTVDSASSASGDCFFPQTNDQFDSEPMEHMDFNRLRAENRISSMDSSRSNSNGSFAAPNQRNAAFDRRALKGPNYQKSKEMNRRESAPAFAFSENSAFNIYRSSRSDGVSDIGHHNSTPFSSTPYPFFCNLQDPLNASQTSDLWDGAGILHNPSHHALGARDYSIGNSDNFLGMGLNHMPLSGIDEGLVHTEDFQHIQSQVETLHSVSADSLIVSSSTDADYVTVPMNGIHGRRNQSNALNASIHQDVQNEMDHSNANFNDSMPATCFGMNESYPEVDQTKSSKSVIRQQQQDLYHAVSSSSLPFISSSLKFNNSFSDTTAQKSNEESNFVPQCKTKPVNTSFTERCTGCSDKQKTALGSVRSKSDEMLGILSNLSFVDEIQSKHTSLPPPDSKAAESGRFLQNPQSMFGRYHHHQGHPHSNQNDVNATLANEVRAGNGMSLGDAVSNGDISFDIFAGILDQSI